MRWSDETAVSYTNWEDGDSSDLSPLDTCVALHTNTGKWENISCVDDVENGVVCQSVESKVHFTASSCNHMSDC